MPGQRSGSTSSKSGGGQSVDKRLWEAIKAALDKGYRVELIKDKEGNIKAQTVSRKLLK